MGSMPVRLLVVVVCRQLGAAAADVGIARHRRARHRLFARVGPVTRGCIPVVGVVTGLVTFSILLVHAMQYPFSGDVSIRPGPYEVVVTAMKERAAGRLNR